MKKIFISLIVISQFLSLSCGDGVTSPIGNYEISDHILGGYFVTSIAFDSKNTAWIGTFDQGIIKYDGTTTHFDNSNSELPDSLVIWSLAVDHNDVLWIASTKGLIKFENDKFHIYNKNNAPLVRDNVLALTVDHNNSIWFSSSVFREGGIMNFDGINWKLFTPQNSSLPGSLINDITIDDDNNVWATINEGVNSCSIVKINGDNIKVFNENETNIPLYYLRSICAGSNNNIYASLDYSLSSMYDPTRPNIIMYNGNDWKVIDPVDENGERLSNVGKIATDLNGNLWTATSEGIAIYNGQRWSKLNLDVDFSLTYTSSITPDRNNNIWIATGEGIYVLNEEE